MKKLLLTLAALAMFLFASPVYADTVRVVTEAKFINPSGNDKAEFEYAFRGIDTIRVQFGGKTCTLNGSARGSVPMGCNYTIFIRPDGSFGGELRAGNSVCTPSANVAASCQ
ncbi:MAG: hypothetical protein VKK04_16720 [Synechococcales bacterium]|nr:hypothetical protein [Synechococcales bacterium]